MPTVAQYPIVLVNKLALLITLVSCELESQMVSPPDLSTWEQMGKETRRTHPFTGGYGEE